MSFYLNDLPKESPYPDGNTNDIPLIKFRRNPGGMGGLISSDPIPVEYGGCGVPIPKHKALYEKCKKEGIKFNWTLATSEDVKLVNNACVICSKEWLNPNDGYYTECNHEYCIECLSRITQCEICYKVLNRTYLCNQIKERVPKEHIPKVRIHRLNAFERFLIEWQLGFTIDSLRQKCWK